ncbi:MAG TPA: N-acetylmuramoyl-L-alanine amidase, partial [Pseudonocardiaceae bacterium]
GWGRIPAGAGNTYAIGVETDHTVGEAWPAAQLEGLRRGTAALLRHLGAHPSDALCGHLEYAPGRKIAPAGLDMAAERRIVAELLEEDMPSLREIEDAAYRAVLNALNDARHGRNPTAVEARDSLGIMALEQRQHQSRYSTPDGRRSDYTATPVDYLLNVDAHVYQLLVDALPAAVREIKEAVAAPQVDLDALADKVAERIADQVAVRVADILAKRPQS